MDLILKSAARTTVDYTTLDYDIDLKVCEGLLGGRLVLMSISASLAVIPVQMKK